MFHREIKDLYKAPINWTNTHHSTIKMLLHKKIIKFSAVLYRLIHLVRKKNIIRSN